jgi:hypothetical protein
VSRIACAYFENPPNPVLDVGALVELVLFLFDEDGLANLELCFAD